MLDINKSSKPKRVACLYRVSKKQQLTNGDIPVQKKACREFINATEGWQLVKEYEEKGVSGFRLSSEQRATLMCAMNDAEQGLFDVLLVFMFDRLGRRDVETPRIIECFIEQGVEVWSVVEGQQKIDTQKDRIINFIRGWQSADESIKTSIRVVQAHKQMVESGSFRGGTPPYGYKLVPSGEYSKTNRELKKLAINEEEAQLVRKIFDLAYYDGFGRNRIAQWLNNEVTNKIKPRNKGNWTVGVVGYLLKNPIYKGYMVTGRTTREGDRYVTASRDNWTLSKKRLDDLVIVDEHIWDKVQAIRELRSPDNTRRSDVIRVNTNISTMLLVGIIYCGHCGSPLTTTYNYKQWKLKDGTEKTRIRNKYRCSGKSVGGVKCDGQTIYAQKRVEDAVLKQLDSYLNELKQIDLTARVNHYRHETLDKDNLKLNESQRGLEECYKELTILKNEVTKSLMGKSSFSPELLSNLIKEKEQEIIKINELTNELAEKVRQDKQEVHDMLQLQRYIPIWKEEFQKAPADTKKIMLSYLLGKVTVYRDKIELDLKLRIT